MGVTTATWDEITYGDPHVGRRRAMQWIPNSIPSNSLKPCLIYCGGRGWHGRHPSFFYDPVIGEPLFNDHISPAETTTPIACFSMFQASKTQNFYDNASQTAWLDATAYVKDDKRKYDGEAYLCIKNHTSVEATDEPGVGSSWTNKWYLIPKADVSTQYWDGYAETASYRGSGIRDLQVLIQYIVENAALLGIDPTKICVMGSSAGGQQAGCVAYSDPAPFVAELNQVLSNPDASSSNVTPAACVLHITPDSFNNYNNYSALANNLFNTVTSQADWDTTPSDEKAALSPLDTLNATGNSIPTFLAYGGNGNYRGEEDDPPYGDTDAGGFHKARNGWQMNLALQGLNQTGVTYVDDAPDAPAPLGDGVAKSQFGMNLSPNKDYNPQTPFANVMKSSREWFAVQSGVSSDFNYTDAGTGDLYRPDLNGDKYPLFPLTHNGSGVPLDPGETEAAATLIFWDLQGKWKDGVYIVKHDGEGTLIFGHSAEQQYGVTSWSLNSEGSAYNLITSNAGQGIYLKVNTSNPNDPVRNISVVHLDDVDFVQSSPTYLREKYTFNLDYIASVENSQVLRFMDWGETNTSNITSYDGPFPQVPTRDWCTWTLGGYGVPIDVMIELCNQVQADMWYCIPHQLPVAQMVGVAAAFAPVAASTGRLDETLTLYLEYSNEFWNSAGGFEQNAWMQIQADVAELGGPGASDYDNLLRWYSENSVALLVSLTGVMAINASTGGYNLPTIKKVLGSSSVNSYTTRVGLDYVTTNGIARDNIDCLAIAPYIGGTIGNLTQAGRTPAQIVADLEAERVIAFTDDAATYPDNLMRHKGDCDTRNVEFICYEAGQHITDTLSNDASRAAILAAQRSTNMNTLYDDYMAAWALMEDVGDVGVMVLFEHCQKYHEADGTDRDSSFGMLEWIPWSGSPTSSEKWLAFTDTIGGVPGDPPGATTYNVYEDTTDHNTPTRTILSTEEPLNIFNWLKTTLSF